MKFFLVVVLFCGTAMADGQMGSGGYAPCTPDCTSSSCPPNCTPPCENGGCRMATPADTGSIKVSDRVIIYLSKFIVSVLR